MRLLLDSDAFIWFVVGSERLSATARDAIRLAANDAWVSHASLWELTIKQASGRLELPAAPDEMADRALMRLLPVDVLHIRRTATLPNLHGDSLDRMLVAQALEEGLVLVTADAAIRRCPVAWLW